MEKDLAYYAERFQHLRQSPTKFGPAPHKAILLLSIIRGIELGFITENKIEYIDLLKPLKEYALIKGNHTVTLDGIHPTILGHGIIAQQVINYLWISE